ncbi:MAG: transposase [Anaerolineaceae bacterium]|nr:transposase [Anaerolineaceae bacterium]
MKHHRKHTRRSIRLRHYDYRDPGAYFVTICTYRNHCVFGNVQDDAVILSDQGLIAKSIWEQIPTHFSFITLDHFVIMPNHVHGILLIGENANNLHTREQPDTQTDVGAQYIVPLHQIKRSFGSMVAGSLPSIIRTYKAAVTREINRVCNTSSSKIWQRNYYEHVIRDERDLNRIREYIQTNPSRWAQDEYYREIESGL